MAGVEVRAIAVDHGARRESAAQVRQRAELSSRGTRISRRLLDCSPRDGGVSSRCKMIQAGGGRQLLLTSAAGERCKSLGDNDDGRRWPSFWPRVGGNGAGSQALGGGWRNEEREKADGVSEVSRDIGCRFADCLPRRLNSRQTGCWLRAEGETAAAERYPAKRPRV